MGIILASKSPRRRELLSILGIEFTVMTEDIDENISPSANIEDEIKRLSFEKAKAVSDNVSNEDIIIAADTVVVLGSRVFGKPKDAADAERMLTMLSGKTHRVITGVTVLKGNKTDTRAAVTEVTFRDLTREEILGYIRTGDPFDKAGGYALQGISNIFVSGINGDHFNVYGLPLSMLALMLRGFDIKILEDNNA